MSIATEIGSLLTSAAASVAPPTADVRAGEPDVVNVPTFAYWYTGTGTWDANTLSVTQETSDWHIRVILPAGPRFVPADQALDDWLERAVSAIRGQFYGHVGLNGAASGGGLELTDAKAGWIAVPNTQFERVVDMDLRVLMAAVHAIAK